ncbi:MAG: TIGR00153 family protein [Chlamydiota bacterium]|jgi:predicted phosphate transport protein (TIGR00153 family)
MYTIAKLFGKSPFAPLQTHMEKVAECIALVPLLFESLLSGSLKKIEETSKKISKLEHEADQIKNDIRNHLPKSIFLPIDRGALLEILALQDSLADQAEDIAVTISVQKFDKIDELLNDFTVFYKKNLEAFYKVHAVMQEIDALLESSFGGVEAQKTKELIEKVAFFEHEADRIQHQITKKLYDLSTAMPYGSFHLWMRLLKEIAAISNLSEKLANRVRMILEVK